MRRVLSVVSVLLAVVLAGGCQVSAGKRVAKSDVEQRISEKLGPQLGGSPQSVSCPDDLKGEKGATMRCSLVTAGGAKTDVIVTVTSVEGNTVNFDMKTA